MNRGIQMEKRMEAVNILGFVGNEYQYYGSMFAVHLYYRAPQTDLKMIFVVVQALQQVLGFGEPACNISPNNPKPHPPLHPEVRDSDIRFLALGLFTGGS